MLRLEALELFERLEDASLFFRGNAWSRITDGEANSVPPSCNGDVDTTLLREFDGVSDEIREDEPHEMRVARDLQVSLGVWMGAQNEWLLPNFLSELGHHLVRNAHGIELLEFRIPMTALDARVGEERFDELVQARRRPRHACDN